MKWFRALSGLMGAVMSGPGVALVFPEWAKCRPGTCLAPGYSDCPGQNF